MEDCHRLDSFFLIHTQLCNRVNSDQLKRSLTQVDFTCEPCKFRTFPSAQFENSCAQFRTVACNSTQRNSDFKPYSISGLTAIISIIPKTLDSTISAVAIEFLTSIWCQICTKFKFYLYKKPNIK